MAGRSRLTATPAQAVALRELARSDIRGEADRARAILLTLDGWTRLAASWETSARIRFALRNAAGEVVMTMGGSGSGTGDEDRVLGAGTYRLSAWMVDGGSATFVARVTWRHDD